MTNTSTATQSMVVTPVGSDLTSASSLDTTVTTSSSLATSVGTSAPPSVQLGKGDGLSTKLALKQRFVKTRPLYANSFGGKVFERSTRSNSRLKIIGWRVTSIVQQIWELLEPSLISLVQAKRQELELKRPSGTIGNPGYALRCFLMGPDKGHATPYVAVLCATSWLRKGMGKLIMESRLLEADGFECCGLPDKPELYGRKDSKTIDESSSGGNLPDNELESERSTSGKSAGVYFEAFDRISSTSSPPMSPFFRSPPHQPILGDTNSPAIVTLHDFHMDYTFSPGLLNGREVEVLYNGNPIGKATVGGIVAVGSDRFEMTVRHIFSRPQRLSQCLSDAGSPGENGLEIDMFDSDYEDSEQNGDEDGELLISFDSDDDDLDKGGTEGDELPGRVEVPERFVFSLPTSPSAFGDSGDNGEMEPKSYFNPDTSGSGQTSHHGLAQFAAVVPSPGREVTVSNPPGATSFYDYIIPEVDIKYTPIHGAPKSEPHTTGNDSDGNNKSGVEYAVIDGAYAAANDSDIKFDSPKLLTWNPILAALDQKFDWALRKLLIDLFPSAEHEPSDGGSNLYFTRLVPTGSQRTVILKTPFDLKPGILESSGVIGVPFESAPQPVHVVSMSSVQIRPGECGSWAMKQVDGTFVGMLIGSCPTLGEAYILRMSDILDDIHNQTGLPAEVAPTYQAPPGYLEKYSNYKRDKQLETPLVAPESMIAAESKKRRLEAEYDSEEETMYKIRGNLKGVVG